MLVSIPARCSLVSSRSLRCASSWDSSPIIVILPWYLLIHFGILWMGEKFLDHVDLIMGNGPCKGPNTMLYLSLKLDHGNLTLTCLWMHMPLGEVRTLMRGIMMIFLAGLSRVLSGVPSADVQSFTLYTAGSLNVQWWALDHGIYQRCPEEPTADLHKNWDKLKKLIYLKNQDEIWNKILQMRIEMRHLVLSILSLSLSQALSLLLICSSERLHTVGSPSDLG